MCKKQEGIFEVFREVPIPVIGERDLKRCIFHPNVENPFSFFFFQNPGVSFQDFSFPKIDPLKISENISDHF